MSGARICYFDTATDKFFHACKCEKYTVPDRLQISNQMTHTGSSVYIPFILCFTWHLVDLCIYALLCVVSHYAHLQMYMAIKSGVIRWTVERDRRPLVDMWNFKNPNQDAIDVLSI